MGRKRQAKCIRGHSKAGSNMKLKGRGTACRACECALSQAHNCKVRKGQLWSEADLQAYADVKFEEILAGGL